MHSSRQSLLSEHERLIRVVFWTLWILTVGLTAYSIAASGGFGLFIPDQRFLAVYGPIEASVASALAGATVVGLVAVYIFQGRRRRRLRAWAFAAFLFFIWYLSIPRF